MRDHRKSMVYADGFDEASECHYAVTVSVSEAQSAIKINVNEVSLHIDYHFFVGRERKLRPIAETNPPGFKWAHPCSFSQLQERIILVLENARIPSAARNDTAILIFEKLVTENWLMNSSVGYIFGVNLHTKTTFEPSDDLVDHDGYGYDEEEEEVGGVLDLEDEFEIEDEDEGQFGRVLEESMEEDYSREMPARREVVEALERVRVSGGQTEMSCVVCLDQFSLGIEVTKMPFSHLFHRDCIVTWLQSRCFCPLCKFELPYGEEEEEPMEANSGFGIEGAIQEDYTEDFLVQGEEPMEQNSHFGTGDALQDYTDFLLMEEAMEQDLGYLAR